MSGQGDKVGEGGCEIGGEGGGGKGRARSRRGRGEGRGLRGRGRAKGRGCEKGMSEVAVGAKESVKGFGKIWGSCSLVEERGRSVGIRRKGEGGDCGIAEEG